MNNTADQPPPPQSPPISESQIQGLASIGATEQEISDYLGLTCEQLESQFGPLIRRRRAWFRITLRQKQFTIATQEQGDLKMLQWLGRFNLNQSAQSPPPPNPDSQLKTYIGIDPETI